MLATARNVLRVSGRASVARTRLVPVTTTVRSLATTTSWLDVTQEIKVDHDNVRDLFERYEVLMCGA